MKLMLLQNLVLAKMRVAKRKAKVLLSVGKGKS